MTPRPLNTTSGYLGVHKQLPGNDLGFLQSGPNQTEPPTLTFGPMFGGLTCAGELFKMATRLQCFRLRKAMF